MKRSRGFRFLMFLLVVAFISCGLYAASSNGKRYQAFQSLDLTTASFSEVQKTYEEMQNEYVSEYQELRKQLLKAYTQNNATKYYSTLQEIGDLPDPRLTKDQSEAFISRMMNATGDEKAQWANWLYQNSNSYRPVLSLSLSNRGENSQFAYSQEISVKPGEKVTLPTVDLGGANGIFIGWGITPDEVKYKAGDDISMPYTDQKLYAIFQNGIKFSDPVTKLEQLTRGSSAKVPVPVALDTSYLFDGWYNNLTGDKVTSDTVQLADGVNSASYSAYWKSLRFDSISTKYYKDLTVPAGEQIPVLFTLTNQGNESLDDVVVSLESDNQSLRVLSENLSSRYIRPQEKRQGQFLVLLSGESGTKIDATIKVTDSEGASWSQPVTFSIK